MGRNSIGITPDKPDKEVGNDYKSGDITGHI